MDPQETLTQLLTEHGKGNLDALDRMLPILYDELRGIARGYMSRQKPGHTLQPTALVHQVYFKLRKQRQVDWNNRSQFLGVAAIAMRRLLWDYAKKKKALKKGGDLEKVPINEDLDAVAAPDFDLVALELALQELERLEPRHARLVELRYFGGLTIEEAAEELGVAPAKVKRDWAMARAWLYQRLVGDSGGKRSS